MRSQSVTVVAFVSAAVLSITSLCRAQPCASPVNELCDDALEIVFDDLPLNFVGQLGCTNDIIDRPYFDVFFIYHCTVSGEYMVDLCGSVGDTYLKVYDEPCSRRANVLAEDDDACGGGAPPRADPMLTAHLLAGMTYWVEVGSWRPDAPFAPPPNAEYFLNIAYLGIPCPGDTNGDSLINITDLGQLLAGYGTASGAAPADGDVNGDGAIDLDDLRDLLGLFGSDCLTP